jgi:uncharacterized protein YrrD
VNSKHVKGLAVIGAADGTRLGTVDHAFLDLVAMRVVGFSVATGGRPLSWAPEAGLTVDAAEVRSLGPAALTLGAAARGDAVDAAYGALVPLGELAKRTVVTEGGAFVGKVASLDFDERTFRVTQVEVSPGFLRSHKLVPADRLVSIGRDVLVVADAVPRREDRARVAAAAASD